MRHEQWGRILKAEETHFEEREARYNAVYSETCSASQGQKEKMGSFKRMESRDYWEIKTKLNRGNAWICRPLLSSLSCGASGKFLSGELECPNSY